MMNKTITAIATAPGEAGIGIIRISGPDSFEILKTVFRYPSGTLLETAEPRRMLYGWIYDGDELLDEAMVVYMKAPYTYTGEDVVEIQCHGSPVTLRQILSLVIRKGASLAERGEFTRRAFLNGRIDLSEAEAVIDVIQAKSRAGSRTAVAQLSGRLSGRIRTIRKKMADLTAEIAAEIEYPEEDLEEMTYSEILSAIDDIYSEVKSLADTASAGKIMKDGCRIALAGRPNVGKSSLMNHLLREDRAIVTDIPGTTRDTIEEYADLDGIPVRITDTAGIRESKDKIEMIGVEKSREAIENSDIVVFLLDSSEEMMEEDRKIFPLLAGRQCIVVLNKSDLTPVLTAGEVLKETGLPADTPQVVLSAETGSGIRELTEEIKKLVYRGEVELCSDVMIADARHEELILETMQFLLDARSMVARGEALDFAESDLRSAWMALGEITGESVSDDIVEEIFSRFCLGK